MCCRQLDSLFILNNQTYITPTEATSKGIADCSRDDAKFNYCYSGRGWPKYIVGELQEDDQVKDYCPNADVRLSRKDFEENNPAWFIDCWKLVLSTLQRDNLSPILPWLVELMRANHRIGQT